MISVSEPDGVAIVQVGGELDLGTAPQLLTSISELIDSGSHRVVLDLHELTFCDSAGLSALVRIRKRVEQVDGALILTRPAPIVKSVLDLTGMGELIPIYSTVDQGRAAAGSKGG